MSVSSCPGQPTGVEPEWGAPGGSGLSLCQKENKEVRILLWQYLMEHIFQTQPFQDDNGTYRPGVLPSFSSASDQHQQKVLQESLHSRKPQLWLQWWQCHRDWRVCQSEWCKEWWSADRQNMVRTSSKASFGNIGYHCFCAGVIFMQVS